ncbi:MAG: DcrB-related protein [Candidatus Zixiibacteriota bacterium]|nr:MAG: DcrB-related protein [candidate division Zixibacteria bacterium]
MVEFKNRFRIDFPDGWEDQTIYTFKGPDDSGVQHNLVLIIDNEVGGVDLNTYAKLRLESIKDTLTGFELMGQREKELKSGNKAYEIVYKWTPAENKTLVQKQVFTIIGGKAYNFTSSFSKKTIQTIGVQVDEIIDSFNPGSEQAG